MPAMRPRRTPQALFQNEIESDAALALNRRRTKSPISDTLERASVESETKSPTTPVGDRA